MYICQCVAIYQVIYTQTHYLGRSVSYKWVLKASKEGVVSFLQYTRYKYQAKKLIDILGTSDVGGEV